MSYQLTKVGFISKAFGFQGQLQCVLEMTKPDRILKHDFLFVEQEGLPVPFLIEDMDVREDQMKVKLEGIDSQEKAKTFSQKEIFLENLKADKVKTPLTWMELKGYQAQDLNHGSLGIIEEVMEYPMNIVARATFEGKEIMFPLNEDFVQNVDNKLKIVHLNLPEGLLDVYLK